MHYFLMENDVRVNIIFEKEKSVNFCVVDERIIGCLRVDPIIVAVALIKIGKIPGHFLQFSVEYISLSISRQILC